MANAYKSFYLEDLRNTIRKVAMDQLMWPEVDGKQEENANIAFYNDGIVSMAEALIDALETEGEDEK